MGNDLLWIFVLLFWGFLFISSFFVPISSQYKVKIELRRFGIAFMACTINYFIWPGERIWVRSVRNDKIIYFVNISLDGFYRNQCGRIWEIPARQKSIVKATFRLFKMSVDIYLIEKWETFFMVVCLVKPQVIYRCLTRIYWSSPH